MNLIFDIGNVICEWNPQALLEKLFETPARQQEALQSVIQHHDWVMLDKGLLDVEQAVANAAARSSLDKGALHRIYLETPVSLTPFTSTVDAIRNLKSMGYPLYILSNMQRHSWDWLYPRYDFWSLFNGIVVSYQINMVKPDREIFEYITSRYSLDSADTLFLDDMQVNVAAAEDYGMQTILVSNIQQALHELYLRLGIRDTGYGVRGTK